MSIIYNISNIEFGVLSEKEIIDTSVCQITNAKLTSDDIKSVNKSTGNIYDPRMGTMNRDQICVTCNLDIVHCQGHLAYIKFERPIIHPLFYKYVLMFLRCICKKCHKLLLSDVYIEYLKTSNNVSGYKLFENICTISEKYKNCSYCSGFHPKFSYNNDDQIIYTYKDSDTPKIYKTLKILDLFSNVVNSDISKLGFNPEFLHPRNLIITVFPVTPSCARPFVISENICDDDMTTRYIEISKINENLKKCIDGSAREEKLVSNLKFKVKTLIDNSNNKSKYPQGRSIRSIKDRISGKDGLVRNSIMGKRVNQSGRTVISPDPTIRLSEVSIPLFFSQILTKPEMVNDHNMKYLEKIVNNAGAYKVSNNDGKDVLLKYALYDRGTVFKIGDIVTRDGKSIKINSVNFNRNNKNIEPNQYINGLGNLKETDIISRDGKVIPTRIWKKKYIKLHPGYIVHRFIKDGDSVVINRQPSLHAGSIMGYKTIIRPQKTISYNLASTKSFNADFDGDEMNIFNPQSYKVAAEIQELSAATIQIITPRSSESNITIVQDSLIGIYLMTSDLPEHQIKPDKSNFFQIIMQTNIPLNIMFEKFKIVEKYYKHLDIYSGKVMASLLFPNTFSLHTQDVSIDRGILHKGVLNKSIVNGLITRYLNKEYPHDIVINFIDNIQFISVKYLEFYGFSIGIDDFLSSNEDKISDIIDQCISEAAIHEQNTKDPIVREIKVNTALSKAKDMGMQIARDALKPTNNFITSIKSGAKGDFFNICQVVGLVAQQNLGASRIQPALSRNKRSLPHYHFDGLTDLERYESQGFIKNSFLKGLNPREFFFHSMSGRLGVVNTAVSTASSGYNQRKLIKIMEDLKAHNDGTVRDIQNNIIQFAYGNNGLDPTKTPIINGTPRPFNIERITNKLNLEFEFSSQ
jgi:DNA-directed RNA polymerase beta' subunit